MTITIDFDNTLAEELQGIRTRLADKAMIHASMVGAAEIFVKDFGADASTRRHDTASRLGATPTGHLAQAYRDIEGQSDAGSARLLVPRASRLRAAFGAYTVRPGAGKKFLTIPVAAESYGRRAGEFTDLQFMRVGPKKTPILARQNADGGITTLYFLTTKADIKEDASLIPFTAITEQAADAAELFILTGPAT